MKLLKGIGLGVVACLAAGIGFATYSYKKDPELRKKVEHTVEAAKTVVMRQAQAAQERAVYEEEKAVRALEQNQHWAKSEWDKVIK